VKSAASADALATGGEMIGIYLNGCGGPCTGNEAINAWINVSAKNLNWATSYNTASANFSHNGKGAITVAQAGTYVVYTQGMTEPTADTNIVAYYSVAINGAVLSAEHDSLMLSHGFWKGGMWAQSKYTFLLNLSAGSVITYIWEPLVPQVYWAHDGYTNLRIVRIR